MIDLSQELIATLILYSLVCGVCLGVLYEVARFIRCLVLGGDKVGTLRAVIAATISFLSDLVFIILCAACGILITFEMCDGVFRGVVYVGIALGLLIYRVTLGMLTSVLVERLANVVKRMMRWVFRMAILPFRVIKFLIVGLYALTIGKIIGRIKERIIIKRLKGAFESEVCLGIEPPMRNESCESAYKREGRISFGGKKDI